MSGLDVSMAESALPVASVRRRGCTDLDLARRRPPPEHALAGTTLPAEMCAGNP